MKRFLTEWTAKKLVISVIVMCLVVFGGYFALHRMTAKAGNTDHKKVVNTLDELNAMCESGSIKPGPQENSGTKDDPFLILEIVPYVGQAEIGYLIDGLEPVECRKKTEYYGTNSFTRSYVESIFEDEFNRHHEEADWSPRWEHKTDSKTLNGYYEKVGAGKKGDFKISGYFLDESGIFTPKDESGNAQPVYRPVFEKVAGGIEGGFNWTSLGSDFGDDKVKQYVRLEGRYVTSEAATAVDSETAMARYRPGDREYSTRTDTGYYSMPKDYKADAYFVHLNDFLRTSLGTSMDDRTPETLDSMYIAYKVIEPEQLAAEPQWIDYADLIYMHHGGVSIGKFNDLWKFNESTATKDVNADEYKRKRVADTHGDATQEEFSTLISSKFTSDHDFSWKVARKLFFKMNMLNEYDGNGTYHFAPLLFSVSALDNLNGIGSNVYADSSKKNVDHYYLEYRIMESYRTILDNPGQLGDFIFKDNEVSSSTDCKVAESGTNCNIYKFMLMNFLMDQQNFYNYFFVSKRATTGEPVLCADDSDTKGLNRAQNTAEAQEYWNVPAFLPLPDKNWHSGYKDGTLDQYGINHYGGAYLNLPRPYLHGATFIYNSDSLMSQAFNANAIGRDEDLTGDAFKFYEDEYGESYQSMSPAQMIFYLLNYKPHSNNDPDPGDGSDNVLHVLEIEPCADFIINDEFMRGYLPPSMFSGNVEVDHMTTQELNGYRRDLNSVYDMIYIGTRIGKFNRTETTVSNGKAVDGYTLYNDKDREEKIYLHVGDQAEGGTIRSSGDDISSLKLEQLKQFVKSGNALVLEDILVKNNGDYKAIMDVSANMHKLVHTFKSGGNIDTSSYPNVCKLSALNYAFVFKNTWLGNGVYKLPKRGATSMTKAQYEAFTDKYKNRAYHKTRVLSGPTEYDSTNGDATSLSASVLDFSFVIGDTDTTHSYGVRIFIDTDYDGLISDNSEKSELVYDSGKDGTSYTYETETATDDSGTPYTSNTGQPLLVPKIYTISYDVAKYYSNRKLLPRQNGSLVWYIEVYNMDNKQDYSSKYGTSAYLISGNEGHNINALQLVTSKTGAVNLEENNTLFKKYAEGLAAYEISVTTKTLDEFEAEVSVENFDLDTYFADYGMLIVSCGEAIQERGGAVASTVQQLIETGVSVAYTGETINKDKGSKELNAPFKDALDMSRFTGGDYKDANEFDGDADSSDYKSIEYTYAALMEEGSGQYKVFDNNIWKNGVKYGSARAIEKKISRTNLGAVSRYPYKISEKVDITGAKAQDYQLNMDNPNLSVWYTLSGLDSTDADDSLYGISPKDATNNYYLYTVENVGYIGIDLANCNKDEEMKLFINMLVGIDGSGYKYPYVVAQKITAALTDRTDGELTLDEENTKRDIGLYFFNGEFLSGEGNQSYIDYGEEDATELVNTAEPISVEDEAPAEEEDATSTETPESEIVTPEPDPTPTVVPEPAAHILISKDDSPRRIEIYKGDKYYDDATCKNIDISKYGENAFLYAEFETEKQGGNKYVLQFKFSRKDDVNNIVQKDYNLPEGEKSFKIPLKDIKSEMESAYRDQLTITYLGSNGSPWSDDPLQVAGIFESEDQLTNYLAGGGTGGSGGTGGTGGTGSTGGTGGTSGSTGSTAATEKSRERTDVTGTDFMPERGTHRVDFTPYDGNIAMGGIRSLKITLVNDTTGDDTVKTKSTIKKIFQDYTDAAGTHTWMYKASADGTFTVNDGNYLKDSEDYYFYFDDHFAEYSPRYYSYKNDDLRSNKYHYVKFDISNRKKTGTTYVNMYYTGVPDSTYVFELD